MMEKVFLGVSGGVDSFASALMLKDKGYSVVGVHLCMNGEPSCDVDELSQKLGIEIISHDVSSDFKKYVVDKVIDTYIDGGVPSPCVECNRFVKLVGLRDVADSNGGGLISTGHYCNIVKEDGLYYIKKGVDEIKDQSYYFWKIGQDILSRIIFPLADLTKVDIFKYVQESGYIEQAKKRESMGICFMQGKSLRDYLCEQRTELLLLDGGDVVDKDNNVIGKHRGYPFYTLAQRKGLSLNGKGCVISVDKDNNTLVIGDKDELHSDSVKLKNVVVISRSKLLGCDNLTIKVRGVGFNPEGVVAIDLDGDRATLSLSSPAWAVARGQHVVFYDGDLVLGGGEIE